MKEKLLDLEAGDIVKIVYNGKNLNKIAKLLYIDIDGSRKSYVLKILDTGKTVHYGRKDSLQKIETIKVKFKLPKCYD
jgi:hypothetical protein